MLKKYILFINLFLSLLAIPLLFFVSFSNIENIYHFNFNDISFLVIFLYFVFSVIFLSTLKKTKILDKIHILKEELVYLFKFIIYFILLLSIGVFLFHYFMVDHIIEENLYLRAYGRVAYLYFALALIISPIMNFIKNPVHRENLILIRKTLGILAFIFFIKHGLEYFAVEYIYQTKYSANMTYLSYAYGNILKRPDALSGVIGGILMFLLGISSNKFSVKLFGGKFWKALQSLVYPTFLITIIHVAFASRFDDFYTFLFSLVVFFRLLAHFGNEKLTKNNLKTTKYLCVPCGYIYDENMGDPDSGIEPGTKFEDIPNDWTCPVCGVSKKDFIPYYEEETTVFGGYFAETVKFDFLNEDVLDITFKVDGDLEVKPGQYASFILKDFDGDFNRSFSVVSKEKNNLRFIIKLKSDGRAGKLLKNVKLGDKYIIKGIYGEFVLKETKNPKVFIATGTGISPIINMLSQNHYSTENKLFFGLSYKKEIFFEELLKSFKNLEVNICLSKQELEGYIFGRINLDKFTFSPETEFYICGNPAMVKDTVLNLEQKGFKNIYFEKFN